MENQAKSFGKYFLFKFFFVFLIKLKFVRTTIEPLATNKTTCYTCVEPLVGYTDHTDSCRFFNTTSTMALSYIKECHKENYTGEFECRKLVISYRSVDTYLRRDCVPKGTCAWKDLAESVSNTPISDCVYTDDSEQKLECIYCCDTPLCNRTRSFLSHDPLLLLCLLFFISFWRIWIFSK